MDAKVDEIGVGHWPLCSPMVESGQRLQVPPHRSISCRPVGDWLMETIGAFDAKTHLTWPARSAA
jgi:hypothetical protein